MKERGIMSRQQRLIRLPLVGTILLCLLVGVYLLAWKRFSKPGSPSRIIKHSVETPSEDVLNYWTADKMRNARPATGQNCSRSEKFTLGIVLVPTHSIHFAFVGPPRFAPCRCAESKSCHRHPKIIVTPLQAVPMTVPRSVALAFQRTRS